MQAEKDTISFSHSMHSSIRSPGNQLWRPKRKLLLRGLEQFSEYFFLFQKTVLTYVKYKDLEQENQMSRRRISFIG